MFTDRTPTVLSDRAPANAAADHHATGSWSGSTSATPTAPGGATRFTLYEDDGETTAYLAGAVRTTTVQQQRTNDRIAITIEPARGTYAGAPSQRDNVIELATCEADVTAVTLNGAPLVRHVTEAALDAEPGWYAAPRGWCGSARGG